MGGTDRLRRPRPPSNLAQRHNVRTPARHRRGSLLRLPSRLGAEAFGQAVRNHWGLENRSHYGRDVTFGEDKSRTRVKPGHCARLRSFAINILRANGVENIARELYVNALNFDNALTYRVS